MAVLPSQIIARVGLRVGAYQGVPSAIETAYSTTAIASLLSESIVPSSLKADILFIEQEMANIVGGNPDHSWRALISGVTATIASGGLIPTTDSNSKKIIGVYGQIRDTGTGKPLLRHLSLAEILTINDNPNSMFTLGTYAAVIEPPRCYHTRSGGAVIDVCIYDYDARKTAIDADGELLFPNAGDMYFAGVMSMLANQDGRLVELSRVHAPYYQAWRQALSSGKNEVAVAGD